MNNSNEPEERQEISDVKRRLLQERMRGRRGQAAVSVPEAAKIRETVPLSSYQNQIWLADRFQEGQTVYARPLLLSIEGPLDLSRLQLALDQLVNCNEILRTCFPLVGSEPVQKIQPPCGCPLEQIDLSDRPENEQDAFIEKLLDERTRHYPIELEPPFYPILIRRSAVHHLLFVNMHHIINDAWSTQIIIEELFDLYQREPENPASLNGMQQYRHFTEWLINNNKDLVNRIDFWKTYLPSKKTALELPAKANPETFQNNRAAIHTFRIPSREFAAIKELCAREKTTVFAFLMASFNILLHRYTMQTEIVLGTEISRRSQPEFEQMIGVFINLMPVKSDLGGNPAFVTFLKKLHNQFLEISTQMEVPFEILVKKLVPERKANEIPFIQAFIEYRNYPRTIANVRDLNIREIRLERKKAIFDLTLDLIPESDTLLCSLIYKESMFSSDTIQRMADHLIMLIRSILDDPAAPLGSLQMLSPQDIGLLNTFQKGKEAPIAPCCIHELFEQTAARNPRAIAVDDRGEKISFEALNARADQLSACLRSMGIRPEERVAVCLDRSTELILSALAVWKAGGVYVPLDPALPTARRTYILEDVAPKLLLTSQRYRAAFENLPIQTIYVDSDWESSASSDPGLITSVKPENLAYILYTSGSTGQPKGIAVEHRSLVNVIQWYIRQFQVSSEARASMLTQITFDAAMREIWGNLIGGAGLYIPEESVKMDPALYWRWISENRISISYLPTPLAVLMLQAHFPPEIQLRYLILSGDKLNAIPEKMLPFQLVNLYGPAEATTNCTAAFYAKEGNAAPHIGTPIENVSVYILDSYLNPVPPGVRGEIYIAGEGVSRGYWNNPALTQEKFLPDPFQKNSRIYKSGDMGSFLRDGNIEFFGRVDHQIKIRGQRIELGEIEAAMDRLPGIEKGLVRVFETPSHEKMIAGYVISKRQISEVEILNALQQSLTDAMLPRRIVQIQQAPFNANGKYERISLPEPDWYANGSQTNTSPENQTQSDLLKIWKEILQTGDFGIDDNFFTLGGHSILVTRLCVSVQEYHGKRLPYASVFEKPTIRQLASLLDQDEETPLESSLESNVQQDFAPLAPPQRGMWFLQNMQPENKAYNVNFCLKIEGPLNREALQSALDEIVRRHEILRTSYPVHRNVPVQVVHSFSPVPVEEFTLCGLPEAEWEEAVEKIYLSRQRSFKLQEEIPFRVLLIRCGSESTQLVVIVHHLLFDGTSIDLFIKELSYNYRRAVSPGLPPLPTVPIQYQKFSQDYHKWLDTEEAKQQAVYWEKVFETEPPTLEIPADFQRKKATQAKGSSFLLDLPPELVSKLKAICGRENITPFMLMLTAYKVLLFRYTQQSDLCVGAPISLRKTGQQQGLIGLYINTLAIRSQITGDQPFSAFLREVRRNCLHAYENRDIPFDRLVEKSGIHRSPGTTPLFQVMFQLRRVNTGLELQDDLKVSLASMPYPTAKFDMTLDVRDHGEQMTCAFNYNADLFLETRIAEMAAHFEVLLESIAADPGQAVERLPIMRAEKYHQILHDWNDTASAYPSEKAVHDCFSQTACSTPDAEALTGENTITYRELEEKSNRLANLLLKRGLQPGDLVAVCAHSTPEMVISLLAVLKAGGAYVPIDPEYPEERIEIMLQDSLPRFVLTYSEWLPKIKSGRGGLILLDQDWETVEAASSEKPDIAVQAGSPAYVIYTSGSTGTPKGVVVPHRAINRLVRETDYIQIRPDDTIAQVSNLSFDAATFEVWGALLNGARLALISKDTLLTPPVLKRKLEDHNVSIMFLTTALFNYYADRHPEILSGLRCLLFGGEEANPARVKSLLESGYAGRLLHVYGPTENTTFSTWYPVEHVPENAVSIPIGKPIANSRALILDSSLNLLPPGIPGELYLGGDGLALGYLNQPGFTAEKFIPDPFDSEAQGKLYATGDICQYTDEGNIVFLGRKDEQIKIRGFRVELGEIKTLLQKHPAVKDAVVVLSLNEAGEKFLAAYLTPSADPIETEQIRTYLQGTLPFYMIPASIMWLETIPISPNGKVDRTRLPLPNEHIVMLEIPEEKVLTSLQSRLVEIWKRTLERDQVGLHDNFFDLGGHSILIVRLCVEIEETLGIPLSFSEVFEAPTVAMLARLLEKASDSTAPMAAAETLQPGLEKAFFWIGSGFWHFQKHLKTLKPVRIPEQGEDGRPVRFHSVEELAGSHVERIIAIQADGPYHLGGFSFGGMVAFETARQLREKGHEVGLLCLVEPTQPRAAAVQPAAQVTQRDQPDSFSRLLAKLSSHAANLSRIEPGKRGGYFWDWLNGQYRNRIAVNFVWRLSPLYHQRGKKIPLKWRQFFIKGTNDRLSRLYQPEPYPGKMILVKRETFDSEMSPSKRGELPAKQTEKIIVEGCISHEGLMHDPYALEWIRKIVPLSGRSDKRNAG